MEKFGTEIAIVEFSGKFECLTYSSWWRESYFLAKNITLQWVKLWWCNVVQIFFWLSSWTSSNVGISFTQAWKVKAYLFHLLFIQNCCVTFMNWVHNAVWLDWDGANGLLSRSAYHVSTRCYVIILYIVWSPALRDNIIKGGSRGGSMGKEPPPFCYKF